MCKRCEQMRLFLCSSVVSAFRVSIKATGYVFLLGFCLNGAWVLMVSELVDGWLW